MRCQGMILGGMLAGFLIRIGILGCRISECKIYHLGAWGFTVQGFRGSVFNSCILVSILCLLAFAEESQKTILPSEKMSRA